MTRRALWGAALAAFLSSPAVAGQQAQEAFQKGKNLYDRGRYAEAVQVWDGAAASFEGSPIEKTVEFLRAKVQHAMPQASAVPVEKSPEAPPAFAAAAVPTLPNESLGGVLDGAAQKMEAEAAEASRQAAQLESSRSQKIAELEGSFQKGKTLLEAGSYEEALEEWRALIPSFRDPAQAKSLLEDFEHQVQSAQGALKAAASTVEKAAREDETALRLSQELEKLLAVSNARLVGQVKSEIEAQKAREAAAKREREKKSAFFRQTFEKGKALLEKGEVDRAVTEWEALLPFLSRPDDIRRRLDKLRESRRRVEGIQTGLQNQASPAARTEAHPEESQLVRRLDEAVARVKTSPKTPRVADSGPSRWIQTTFEQGKMMYKSGRTREAFQIWGTLQSYLDKEPQMKSYIAKASASAKTPPLSKS